jgi:hypothetical protein
MIAEITREWNSPKTGGIIMQLILGCNSKTTVFIKEKR